MAAGAVHVQSKFVNNTALTGLPTLWASDVIKWAFITISTTPAVNDSNPCWGAGGTQNYSTNECAAGGNYSAGGATLAGTTVTLSGAVTSLNCTSPISIAANAGNPTNAAWVIFYSNTAANKNVVGFMDLGGTITLVNGWQGNINSVSSGTQPLFTGTAT